MTRGREVSRRRRGWVMEREGAYIKAQSCILMRRCISSQIEDVAFDSDATHTLTRTAHQWPLHPLPRSPLLLLSVIRLSVSEKRGKREERRRRLMFNWKCYAGFSLICSKKCSLSPSLSLSFSPSVSAPFPPHVFSLVLSFVSRNKNAVVLLLSLFLPPRCLVFPPLIFPPCQSALRTSSPSQRCASLLRFVCALSCMRVYWSAVTSVFVWIWHKQRLSWTQQINSLQCLALAELGWELQPCFPLQGLMERTTFIYYSSKKYVSQCCIFLVVEIINWAMQRIK